MGLTSDIVITVICGIFAGLIFGFITKAYIISHSNVVQVEVNSQLSVSDVPDHNDMNSRPPSYQSNERERPPSHDSAEAPPPYRSNERIDIEMIEMRPIPPL